jgi:hypothetical protein
MMQVHVSGITPTQVAFAQHHDGQRLPWDDPNAAFLPVAVQREGTHPQVYVALGSHTSYLRPYQCHLGVSGDAVSDQGPVWRPGDYTPVNVGEQASPTPGNEWIRFAAAGLMFVAAILAISQRYAFLTPRSPPEPE